MKKALIVGLAAAIGVSGCIKQARQPTIDEYLNSASNIVSEVPTDWPRDYGLLNTLVPECSEEKNITHKSVYLQSSCIYEKFLVMEEYMLKNATCEQLIQLAFLKVEIQFLIHFVEKAIQHSIVDKMLADYLKTDTAIATYVSLRYHMLGTGRMPVENLGILHNQLKDEKNNRIVLESPSFWVSPHSGISYRWEDSITDKYAEAHVMVDSITKQIRMALGEPSPLYKKAIGKSYLKGN